MGNEFNTTMVAKSQGGFSMLEILITLVIIATALLGTAGLQLYAMRVGKSGELRTQAVFLASDISERIETNKIGAIAGNYVVTATNTPTTAGVDCSSSACDATSLAQWDISQWGTAVAALLPQATWSVTQTVAGNPVTYRIVIGWTERGADKNNRSETFSYTSDRTTAN